MENEKQVDARDKILTKIAQSIIANQVAHYFNQEIRAIPQYYKHELKNALNRVQTILAKAEKTEYDMLFDKAESQTVGTYDAIDGLVRVIAKGGITEFNNFSFVLEAYLKDPARVYGISKKVNSKK